MAAQHLERIESGSSIYVYELPVRLWHAINAIAIIVLAVTGYLISHPMGTTEGEASANFLMGYVRFAHFAAAYIFAAAFLGRVYWAFAGNRYARELFILPIADRGWWAGLIHQLRWYAFLEKAPGQHVGHNPMAQVAMFTLLVLGSVFMIVTGFALYAEGEGLGSWQDRLFGWVIPWFGQSQDVHTWHHLVAWIIVWFVIVHVYAAIREDILSAQTLLKTIATGWRTFR